MIVSGSAILCYWPEYFLAQKFSSVGTNSASCTTAEQLNYLVLVHKIHVNSIAKYKMVSAFRMGKGKGITNESAS